MIKPETIQNIIETARIEEVIGDFVSLKKRGANYLGLCPFHNEKTPSFSVSPSKGIYKCFGCGKAGNVVNFVMEHEHYTYPEALKYLAGRYGIDVEEEEVTPEMRQELDERESMFTLNGFVARYFQQNLLNNEEGKSIGLSYLKEREFLDSTIEKFQLGYAINKWGDYSQQAIKNGYKKDVLVRTGLSIERDSHLIDRFRGRVIFPIHNLTGKVIGFGGRILTSEKSTAKYINSPDSEIYSKSRVLYGIYFSRNTIVKRDNCYLVEGYTDVISLHQAGIENVVASSGTSLTVDQIKLIKRYTPNITILYDGDPAGIKASFRGIDLILEQGMNVKIVLFPEGEDPDSFVRAHRTGEVEEFIQNQATDFIKFKTNLMMGETAGDPSGRASLIKEIISTIAQIPDGINRSVYIRECSIVMDIPEQTLMNELNKTLRRKFSKKKPGLREIPEPPEEKRTQEEQIEIDPLDVSGYEKQIMEFILQFAYKTIMVPGLEDEEEKEWQVVDYIISDFRHDQIRFENETYNEILEEYAQSLGRDQQLDEKYFIYHPKQNISQTVIQLLAEPYQLSENWKRYKIYPKKGEENMEEYFDSYILPLKSRLISKELKKITERLKTTDDEAEMFLLQQQYFELKKIANMLDERRHRIFNH